MNEVELMNGCIAQVHSNLFIPSTLSGSNFDGSGLNKEKLTENVDIAADVYIDRVDGAPCCGTTLQLFKGGKDDTHHQRRPSLLTFLRGNVEEKKILQLSNPSLYKYFQEVWQVQNSHMNKNLPENYVFMLNLCQKQDCPHPLCGREVSESLWYDNGPPLTYVPAPIADPKRPWGGNCKECPSTCAGHYLKPEEHKEFVTKNGTTQCIFQPPSVIIKNEFYNLVKNDAVLTEEHLLNVAKRTMLPLDELKMHVAHLRLTAERRKEGAKKAAITKKAKAKQHGEGTKKSAPAKKTKKVEKKKGKSSCK